jgi:ABC-type bacteriocin/lantibiotic exporter with double-glycine peptidase domain
LEEDATRKVVVRSVVAKLYLFSLSFCVVQADPNPATAIAELPSCGVLAVYSTLNQLGRSVSVAEVEQRFQLVGSDDVRMVSMLSVRRALESYDLEISSRRYEPSQLSWLETPAILYFRPQRWPGSGPSTVGHFVTLAAIRSGTAEIIDWSGSPSKPRRMISTQDIERVWDGEAIVIVTSGKLRWQEVSGVLVSCALVALWLMLNLTSNKQRARDCEQHSFQ